MTHDRRPLVASLAMIGSTVSWRAGNYYSGGADPVVVLKALLSLVALAIAYRAAKSVPSRFELGTRSFWLVGLYLVGSVFGAWAYGNLLASGVLAIRLVILAATVFFLLRAYHPMTYFICLVRAMAIFAIAASVTWLVENVGAYGPAGFIPGTITLLAHSRLHGYIPPLTSNELALLCGTTFLALLWRTLNGLKERGDVVLMVVFIAMVWFTGSRTGLLALVLATVVMLVQVRKWPLPGLIAALAAIPVLAFVIVGTGIVSSYFARGGTANTSNLSNRTVAWSAAAHLYHNFWGYAFGSGLSVKQIPVAGQWWNVQILDSSWVSALVQAGLFGLVLLIIWAVWNIVGASLMPRPERLLYVSLLVFIVFRSLLESGLLDATPAFCIFFGLSLQGEARSRRATARRLEAERAEQTAAALDRRPDPALPVGSDRVPVLVAG